MQTRIQLDVLSREIVKPSSRESNHPITHTLSFFDQIPFPIYTSAVYFYANTNNDDKIDFLRSNLLKSSLSAALYRYYPLAGRRRSDNFTVNCNDEGVLFLETKMRCNLSRVLNQSSLEEQEEAINMLFPDGLHYKPSSWSSPLAVQVTYFECGGMAISFCICHTIMDMSSMSYFFNHWAVLARNPDVIITPKFNLGTLYPPIQVPALQVPEVGFEGIKCVSRTIVFDVMNIGKLKKSAVETTLVENPTRAEVVTALILKCAISAAARVRPDLVKSVTMPLVANLRNRVRPPFSETTMGNFVASFSVSITKEEIRELNWVQIVGKIRNEKKNVFNRCAEDSSAEALRDLAFGSAKWLERVGHDDHQMYICSNWCGFPFYEADFGWGKPDWVTHARIALPNSFHLMDNRDGGIEVVVNLEEQQMAMFERDDELLQFSIAKS